MLRRRLPEMRHRPRRQPSSRPSAAIPPCAAALIAAHAAHVIVAERVAKTLNGTDGKRRILLVQRPDGFFGSVEQYCYQNTYEGELIAEGWRSLASDSSVFQTLEIAEREAKTRYPWLAL
jgi:hypothetical protein